MPGPAEPTQRMNENALEARNRLQRINLLQEKSE